MDEITVIVAAGSVALAALVYFMWRSATKHEWRELTHSEKRRWRNEEERLKEKSA